MLKIIQDVLVKNRVQHSAVLAQEIVDAIDAQAPVIAPQPPLQYDMLPHEVPLQYDMLPHEVPLQYDMLPHEVPAQIEGGDAEPKTDTDPTNPTNPAA